jgi:aspartate carbamoyltransferase catalytic subunit
VLGRLCREAGVSYRELGQAADTHPALVGKIANGRVTERSDSVVLARLAAAIKVYVPSWDGAPEDLQRWESGSL